MKKDSIHVIIGLYIVCLLTLIISCPLSQEPSIFTVTFNSVEATIEANPTSKRVESPATTIDELPIAPTKEGYIFDGWYTEEEGGGTNFIASTVVTEDITVYAKWNTYSYTVTFESQEATIDANPTSKKVESPATTIDELPIAPTKEGYVFEGWFTIAHGGGGVFTASTIV